MLDFSVFKGPREIFGLNISDMSVKLVQFKEKAGRYSLQAITGADIRQDAIAGDVIKNPEALIQAIRGAVGNPKFGKVTTPYVAASIPETKSFVRVIQMQAMSEKEAAEAVPWEAEAYIPLPVGQVYLDWIILDQDRKDGKMTVLITASPRDYIDDLTRIIKTAGLKPVALEVESQATARSLVPDNSDTFLIADIDTVRTSLIIYERGILQFTSSLPIAGNSFTQAISKGLGSTMDSAEKLKKKFGMDPTAEKGLIKKSLVPVVSNLVNEIKNTLRFYEEHSVGEKKVSKLILSGSSGKLKHLPSFLQERLTRQDEEHPLRSLPGIRVELGNPWLKILKKRQTPPLSREDSLSYSTAIGLAVREIR